MKVIGIDTGVNTGFAVWCTEKKELQKVETMSIGEALMEVFNMSDAGFDLYLRIEDARKRTWFKQNNIAQAAQGAGSVKRDASVWESVCNTFAIKYELVHPKNNSTKMTSKLFQQVTKWKGRTSEHSRDAAMLVFQYDPIKNELLKRAMND